jgi:tRNA (guanosine-2'-O-)-methyltransferase
MLSPAIRVRRRRELRAARRPKSHRCWGPLIAAPLWPLHGVNLGTLLRTCDAVGACLAVPRFGGSTGRWPEATHCAGRPVSIGSVTLSTGSPPNVLPAAMFSK